MNRLPDTTSFRRGRLPHWEVSDGVYFVTLSLQGSLPRNVSDDIRSMARQYQDLKTGDALALQRKIFLLMESWLDRNAGNQHLVNPMIAEMVMDAIAYYSEDETWVVYEYVIMPNHIHLMVRNLHNALFDCLSKFKRWTARQANRALGRQNSAFWNPEWFDHWSRSSFQDMRIIQYIRQNPVKAGLVTDYREWRYASWADPRRNSPENP